MPECYFILSLCCAELETPYEPTTITALSQNIAHSSDGPERPIHIINTMSRNNRCDMIYNTYSQIQLCRFQMSYEHLNSGT